MTLKGFKSFASATTLNFEPGITCVVGPNGSGKSNVVDALAWVMGEQGAKSLRGGKMEDVIFMGTSTRAPLGRAEVLLTIDNSDGVLPIEFAEVTIGRTMFRNGGSEYSINGSPCRLLDIQELLSDSGIGREMHVIVGQGQLDSVLQASVEDRRGFIEEAAGVLKHRKRKEKALRKLDAMQANLTRLQDLTAELRRQLKPLGRQAEVARRAVVIQSDARDARLRLLADDLVQMRHALAAEVADETALRERRAEVEKALHEAQARLQVVEDALVQDSPLLAQSQQTWYALAALKERFMGTASLAAERVRVQDLNEEPAGRDPEVLEHDARALRAEEFELGREVERERTVLADAVVARGAAEEAHSAEERRVSAVKQAEADRREGMARLVGRVAAARSRVEAGTAEIERLDVQVADARARAEKAQQEFHALEAQIAGLDDGELGLDAQHEEAAERLDLADRALSALRGEESDADRERATAAARLEALQIGLDRRDGTGALLDPERAVPGVVGAVSALLQIEAGYEAAVGAALGPLADAVAVTGAEAAAGAIWVLRESDGGRASLVLIDAQTQQPNVPFGMRRVRDFVRGPEDLIRSLTALHSSVIVDDVRAPEALQAVRSGLTVVTLDGDVVGPHVAVGGTSRAPSLLEVQAAVDAASAALEQAQHRVERARFQQIAVLV
ncbi:MAG: AAA family ATPase, partial [Actinobacteria bacterium]|nr:AAA family ATPase [Actinomycetota bacterium]